MPNNCWNHLTIISHNNSHELDTLISNEFTHNENVKIIQKGPNGIRLTLWSAWQPDFEWFEGLLVKYPSCWIKNEWDEEGGIAGVWVGYMNNKNEPNEPNKPNEPIIKKLEWDDISIEGYDCYFFLQT